MEKSPFGTSKFFELEKCVRADSLEPECTDLLCVPFNDIRSLSSPV